MSGDHNSTKIFASLFGVQLVFALLLLVAAAFAPPAQGKMLLLPLSRSAAARLPVIAFDRHVLLLGRGPVEGSLVVMGSRVALLMPLLRAGVIAIAAPPALCGGAGQDGGRR